MRLLAAEILEKNLQAYATAELDNATLSRVRSVWQFKYLDGRL